MEPTTAAGVSAAAETVGGGLFSWLGDDKRHRQNRELTQRSENFQREMFQKSADLSSSAYRRSAADMKLAGINPIMAAGGFGAATSPSGGSGGSASGGSGPSLPTSAGNAFKVASEVGRNKTQQLVDVATAKSALSASNLNNAKAIDTNISNRAKIDIEKTIRSNQTSARTVGRWFDNLAENFGRNTANMRNSKNTSKLQNRRRPKKSKGYGSSW